MELAPSGNATAMIPFSIYSSSYSIGNNQFWAPFVSGERSGPTDSSMAPMPRAGTAKNLYCVYTSPPGTSSLVVTLTKNGSTTALTVTIPTTGSGTQAISDTSHTASYSQWDPFDLQFFQASGSGASVSSCAFEVD